MAYTVARPGKINTVLACNGLEEPVVVGILKTALECIVVNVAYR